MAFTVTARHRSSVQRVTWDAGQLSGDPEAVALVQQLAQSLEGKYVGPVTGPVTQKDHLSKGLSALILMDEAFDEILTTTGRVPQAPDVPPGSVP